MRHWHTNCCFCRINHCACPLSSRTGFWHQHRSKSRTRTRGLISGQEQDIVRDACELHLAFGGRVAAIARRNAPSESKQLYRPRRCAWARFPLAARRNPFLRPFARMRQQPQRKRIGAFRCSSLCPSRTQGKVVRTRSSAPADWAMATGTAMPICEPVDGLY